MPHVYPRNLCLFSSQLNWETYDLRMPLFITSQLFPWKHVLWQSTGLPAP